MDKCIILGCDKPKYKVNMTDEETGEEIRDYSVYCYNHMRLSKKPIFKNNLNEFSDEKE